APALEGAIRFLEGAGTRGTLELVAEDLLGLIRGGMPAEHIGLVCPAPERLRAWLEIVLGSLGIPYSFAGRVPLSRTPLGHSLLALLRYAWLGGGREDLYAFLRSPYSGVARREVDFAEGRLRGNAIVDSARVEEETERLRGKPLPVLERLRSGTPVEAVRELALGMLENAYGLESPPAGDGSRHDLRCHEAVVRLLDELETWERRAEQVSRDELVGALERAPVVLGRT